MLETRETLKRKRNRARKYERDDARRHRGNNIPLIMAGLVVAAIAIVLLGNGLIKEFGSSRERADLSEYLGISGDGETVLIIDGETSEEKAVIQNGNVYIPMQLANQFYDNFYYDSLEGHLLVTGATKTTEGIEGTDYIPGETVYVSLSFLSRFVPLNYEEYADPSRVDIVTRSVSVTTAETDEDIKMRVSADKQSPILMDIDKGETVRITEENDDWAEIRYRAVTGYVESKGLTGERNTSEITLTGGNEADQQYLRHIRDHKIVLGFHNVAVADANSYLEEAASQTKGMNVVAPTWFALSDNEGNISDIASPDYVGKAHELGYEVWGVIDNFTNAVDTNEVLARTSKRLILEQNVISLATAYGLDGINIDFEQLAGETGDDFAQFLRELSILTRADNIVLSVDNYVPQDYTDFYRRDIQGRVADYVIIMGYDEHTAASQEAGSVASLGFVTQGIEDTLKEVPAAQVINAIPFYTRKWAYEGGTLSCESLGMRDAQAFIADNGAQTVWDADACQNYASFEKDGVLYSIWLEDSESISSKLAVMTAHDLGGLACWKLTQETPDIWDTITAYYPSGN
ncbi:MAG: SH3 domain-containing protein [Lachnospiraceae bacterium]|nr:SH3 domain-containing protein [Lachnospiraceae bacterium]MBQ9607000.1 SH3 domain-containing protein [Lachnospiraceae bacterium]MBR1524058.1 SH3 domain-containing protein [Lachnospiraceae bacterium]